MKKRTVMFICMAVLLLAGCGKERQAEGITKAGTQMEEEKKAQMPPFTAKDLEGNPVTEEIFAQKDLTVVNVWGTFCSPCVGEMPELGEWAENMPDNVQLVGLIIDIEDEEDKEHIDLALEITQKAEADFVQIIANSDFRGILSEVYGVPTTFFVDSSGCIVGEPVVGAYVEKYKAFVEDYLNEQ